MEANLLTLSALCHARARCATMRRLRNMCMEAKKKKWREGSGVGERGVKGVAGSSPCEREL